MHFIIFDTEFTSWKGCNENGWVDWQKQELVQIGALKVAAGSLEVVDKLDLLIKPTINPILSDYFAELTGITNEQVQEKGLAFSEAYSEFYDFAKNMICFSHGWSVNPEDYTNPSQDFLWCDGSIIHKNLEYYNIEETQHLNYKNLAFWFKEMYNKHNIDIKNQASGDIAKLLGVSENIDKMGVSIHNAIYDAYSILEGVRYFKAEGLFD